jgi:hypothetical protein
MGVAPCPIALPPEKAAAIASSATGVRVLAAENSVRFIDSAPYLSIGR